MASALFDPVRAHPLDIAVDGLAASVRLEMTEVAAIAYCDHMGRVLGTRHLRSNASDMVDMPVRRIAIDMLAFDAAAAVMAHNHPAGDPSPSRADHEMTRQIARALQALGARLHDHVVVARGGRWSFRAAGLL